MIRKFCLTLAVISAASFSMVSAQQTAKVTASGIGYLEYLPQGYNSNSDKYPLVISLHGIKEKGTSSTDRNRVLADLHKVDNVGLAKYVKSGKKYPFILISPQLKSSIGVWPSSYVIEVLNDVKKHLRVDDRRIYLTGLSLGGFGVWRTVGDFPEVFAAVAPLCPGGNALSKADFIASKNLPIWGFHGNRDHVVSHNVTVKMINAVNSAPKRPNPMAKATIFPGMGHNIWDKAYNETNLLDWMLSHRKGSSSGSSDNDDNWGNDGRNDDDDDDSDDGDDDRDDDDDGDRDDDDDDDDDDRDRDDDDDDKDDKDDDEPSNKKNVAPKAWAGPDRVLTLPNNSVDIRGKVSDDDGNVVSIEWIKISGHGGNMSGANTSRVKIYDLQEGVYVFVLRVKDNDGSVKEDYFSVTVKGSGKQSGGKKETTKNNNKNNNNSKNARPVANAGPDMVVRTTQGSVTLAGSGKDADGRIVSYQWRVLAGPGGARLNNAKSPQTDVSNLKKGRYYIALTVKDDKNATHVDKMALRVK